MADKEFNPLDNLVADGGFTAILGTLGCIGDSLSSGEHEGMDENGKKSFNDYYEYSWGQFIARKCGIKVTNMSVGGMNCKDFHHMASYNRYFSSKSNLCQAYIIALGVNDLNNLSTIYTDGFGDINDVDFTNNENNKMSFVGQYVRIIQRIRLAQPKARIFVMTTPRYEDKNQAMDSKSQEKRELSKRYIEFIRSLPNYFEYLYVIDLNKHGPIIDEQFKYNYFLGGHFSAMGYKYWADLIATYIDYIIKNNVDDFRQIGFVGKGVYNSSCKW